MTPGFAAAFNAKVIYVFRINDAAHAGCLKIGETSCACQDFNSLPPNCPELNQAANKRIAQYTQAAAIDYELLHTELAQTFTKLPAPNQQRSFNYQVKSFSDHDVHQVLLRSGIKRKEFDLKNKANEWFVCDLDTVKKAIGAVKEGSTALSSADSNTVSAPIQFRPEQQEAIELTCKQFKKGKTQMLWNAKMRFGKTLSALQVVKKLELRRTIIITHRPVVNESWFGWSTRAGLRTSTKSLGIAHSLPTAPKTEARAWGGSSATRTLNSVIKITSCTLHRFKICAAPARWAVISLRMRMCSHCLGI